MSAELRPPAHKSAAVSDAKQRIIATHVALIGVAAFIPVPFLDDYVKKRVERRLVRRLAAAHGVLLGDADVAILADEKSTWGGRFVGLAHSSCPPRRSLQEEPSSFSAPSKASSTR